VTRLSTLVLTSESPLLSNVDILFNGFLTIIYTCFGANCSFTSLFMGAIDFTHRAS
jgi:hypothetical protein